MKANDLWQKIINDSPDSYVKDKNKLYPLTQYNICGKSIWYLEKNGEQVTIHLVDRTKLAHLGYRNYGAPEENLTYAAALALQRDFGFIEGVTDKDYVVNSYHVDPREEIDAFKKLEIEGEYLALSSGGAVSYVETADLTDNPEAIETLIRFMHDHIMYAEVNRKIGICYACGYQGDVPLTKTENGEFEFTCPNCGEKKDLSVDARLCGYVGTITNANVNKGRLDDIYHRKLHLN